MISWKLWQALKHPPEAHPVYQRTLTAYRKKLRDIPKRIPKKEKMEIKIGGTMRKILIILLIIGAGWLLSITRGLLILLFQPAASLILIALAIANFYAPRIGMKISHQIGRERELGTYDLLNLTPSGALGTSWAICTGYLYHNQRFKDIWSALEPICSYSVATMGIAIFFTFIGQTSTPIPALNEMLFYAPPMSTKDQVTVFLGAIAIISIIYVDVVHSIVMGVILGCLIPNYVEGSFNTSVGTLGSFLGLQVAIYVSTLIAGTVLLPMLFSAVNIRGEAATLGAVILAILFFFMLRAGLNTQLWRLAALQLNVEASGTIAF